MSEHDLFSWGAMLVMEELINYNLRELDNDPVLLAAAHNCYYEAVDIVFQCEDLRPYGSGFLPDILKAVWAATSDTHTDTTMEEILKDYEKDVEGADYIGEALRMKQYLRGLTQVSTREIRDAD